MAEVIRFISKSEGERVRLIESPARYMTDLPPADPESEQGSEGRQVTRSAAPMPSHDGALS